MTNFLLNSKLNKEIEILRCLKSIKSNALYYKLKKLECKSLYLSLTLISFCLFFKCNLILYFFFRYFINEITQCILKTKLNCLEAPFA